MTFRLLSEPQNYSCGKCMACRTGFAALCEHPQQPPAPAPPPTITVTVPRKAWRLLRLGEIRAKPGRVFSVVPAGHGGIAWRVTMDAETAGEIRASAGTASQDKTSFNVRERQAIWKLIPRITHQLERLAKS